MLSLFLNITFPNFPISINRKSLFPNKKQVPSKNQKNNKLPNLITKNHYNQFKTLEMGCFQSTAQLQNSRMRQVQIQRMKRQLQKRTKEISLLEKQNRQLKEKRKEDKLTESIVEMREADIELIEFSEDGQADNDNNHEDPLESLLRCPICSDEYNMKDRIPWLVCKNQHTYCNNCINGMMRRNQDKCPQCRQKIIAGTKNVHISTFLHNTGTKTIKPKGVRNDGPAQQINISVNKSTPFYKHYNFYPPNMIVKSTQSKWHDLLFNQILPTQGNIKFCFQVVFSLYNNIQIGIIDIASKIQQGKMSNKRHSYHLYDGKVMQSDNVDNPITVWCPTGKPAPKNEGCKIVVQVNMDDGEIKWFLNGEVYAETIITNYMRYVKVVPYLAMYHVEDVVNVNAW